MLKLKTTKLSKILIAQPGPENVVLIRKSVRSCALVLVFVYVLVIHVLNALSLVFVPVLGLVFLAANCREDPFIHIIFRIGFSSSFFSS